MSHSIAGWLTRPRSIFLEAFFPAPLPTPELEAKYWREHRAAAPTNWRAVLVACMVVTVIWLPTDFWVWHGDPRVTAAFVNSRFVIAGLTTLAILIFSAIPAVRPHTTVIAIVNVVLVSGYAGYHLGLLGGPSSLWFYFQYMTVLFPMCVALPLRWRVASTLIIGAASLSGYFLLIPANRADPMATACVSFYISVMLLGITGGALTDVLRRRTFLLQEATETQAEELRLIKSQLESRVAEQTQELRALSSHLESTRERERTHIARELHDELGQELTALSYAVEVVKLRQRIEPASIGPNIQEVDELLQRTRRTVGSIVSDLRPRVLDDLGLGAAVEFLVGRVVDRTGLACDVTVPPDSVVIEARVATAAYRIVQECLTNVARHARAARAGVNVAVKGSALMLTVRDDGAGFVVGGHAGAGFGLIGMRERARASGGTLSVESTPGRGTIVTAGFPVAVSAAVSAAPALEHA